MANEEEGMDKNKAVRDALPDGPLKQVISDAIDELEKGNSDED